MNTKRCILIQLLVLIVVTIVGALGYYFLLSKTRSDEMVFAATEVGAPQGDKITKDIGPAGGSSGAPYTIEISIR